MFRKVLAVIVVVLVYNFLSPYITRTYIPGIGYLALHEFSNTDFPRRTPPKITPQLTPIDIAEDFSNIANLAEFHFTTSQKLELKQNRMLIFDVGMGNPVFAYLETPIPFITSDIVLHVYHVLFHDLLKHIEEKVVFPAVVSLLRRMEQCCAGQPGNLGDLQQKAIHKVQMITTIGLMLSRQEVSPDPAIDQEVSRVIESIRQGRIFAFYGSMIDSSDLTPRAGGDYREIDDEYSDVSINDDVLNPSDTKAYRMMNMDGGKTIKSRRDLYRTMKWLKQAGFNLDNETDLAAMVLIGQSCTQNRQILALEALLDYLAGPPDGFTVSQLAKTAVKFQFQKLTTEDLKRFHKEIQNLHHPHIQTAVLLNNDGNTAPNHYWQIFHGTYTLTSDLFARIMEKTNSLPSGLHFADVVLGSSLAHKTLNSPVYSKSVMELSQEVSGWPEEKWYQGFSTGVEYALRSLIPTPPPGYPEFTGTRIWQAKNLNTAMGGWVQLRHDLHLYESHYSQAGDGAGGFERFSGYVEPNPEFFSRLAHASVVLRHVLEQSGIMEIISQDSGKKETFNSQQTRLRATSPMLRRFTDTLQTLENLAGKEIAGIPFDEDDHRFMNGFASLIRHMTFDDGPDPGDGLDKSLICDVVSDYRTHTCLEVATGHPFMITVLVPWGKRLFLSKGSVFSYYEFPQPISNRLTDAKWRAMVRVPGDSLFGKLQCMSPALTEIHDTAELLLMLKHEDPNIRTSVAKHMIRRGYFTAINEISHMLLDETIIPGTTWTVGDSLDRYIVYATYYDREIIKKWQNGMQAYAVRLAEEDSPDPVFISILHCFQYQLGEQCKTRKVTDHIKKFIGSDDKKTAEKASRLSR